MLERVAITLILGIAGIIAWRLFTRWQLTRAAFAGKSRDPLLEGAPSGVPTIVYFTTPMCAPCQLQQTPTLDKLKGEMGIGLHVVRVDATEQPDAASRWGVMTVPTVFVLNRDGSPRKVYNGVVSASVLKQDLIAI